MTFVIVMGFHQIIVVMNDVKRHTYIHTCLPSQRVGPDIQLCVNQMKLNEFVRSDSCIYSIKTVQCLPKCHGIFQSILSKCNYTISIIELIL